MSETALEVADVARLADAIRGEIAKAIVGLDHTVDHLLVALLAGGHVLLEGPPGTAKTFLAQCFSTALGRDFGRIQFTPDLMPADILGSNLFNFQTSQFTLTRGPVFCELLLADEINRTPPKTQAALLEAMQEGRVTLDGETHVLPERFMVVATQNPIESQGVYPLPEAQLDRFLFKLLIPYPSLAEETKIVARFGEGSGPPRAADLGVSAVADRATLRAALGRRGRDAGAAALEAVREVMRRLRAPERVEDMITARVAASLDALHGLDVPAYAAGALTALARSATERTA